MRFLLSLVGVSLATAQQTQKVPMPGSPQIEIAPPEGSAESTPLLGGSDGTDYDYDVTQPSSLTSSAGDSVLSQVLFALSSSDEDNSDDYDYDADIFIVASDPPKSSSHSSHHSSHHSWSNDDDDDDEEDEDRLNEIYHSTPHHLRRQRHNHLAWQPPTLIDMLLRSKYDDDDNDDYSDYAYDFGVSGNSPLSLLDMLFMAPSSMTLPRVPPPPKQPSGSASFSFVFGTPQQMHDARQQTYRMFPPRVPPQQPQLTQTFFVPPPQQPELTQTTFVPPPQQPALTQTTFVPPSPPLTLTQTTFVPPEQQPTTTTTAKETPVATAEISPPVPKKKNPDVATAGAEIAPAPKTNNKAPLPDTVSYRSAP